MPMADDVVPTSEESGDPGADTAARLLAALVRSGNIEVLRRALPEALPWTDFLPPEDTEELLDDLMSAAARAVPPDDLAPIAELLELLELLNQWKRNTAAYADPALYAILTNEYRRPGDDVPAPPVAT